jgi:hypothetical protein
LEETEEANNEMEMMKQHALTSDRFLDAKDPSVFFKKSRLNKTTSLMWILRASTQSSQTDPLTGIRTSSSSLTHQQMTDILSEVLADEGVEVIFGQQQIP